MIKKGKLKQIAAISSRGINTKRGKVIDIAVTSTGTFVTVLVFAGGRLSMIPCYGNVSVGSVVNIDYSNINPIAKAIV